MAVTFSRVSSRCSASDHSLGHPLRDKVWAASTRMAIFQGAASVSHVRRSPLQPGRVSQKGYALAFLEPVPDWLFGEFASPGLKAGDRARTGDVQLGKLKFYH